MSTVDDFYRKDCEKISASCVNAYIDLTYDPENPTGIILDHSWGNTHLDLLPLIKAGETVTSLELTATSLKYNREDGKSDCIHGDDLSRIISLTLLKDVDQNIPPKNGDILVYKDGMWYTFDFMTWKNNTDIAISNLKARVSILENKVANLEGRVTNLEGRVSTLEGDVTNLKATVANHENRLKAIELKLTPPADAPSDVKVAFGNINNYGDVNNTGDKSKGIYTHTLATNVIGDQRFA